ncbi:PEP-CTERM sorting domain-containing protein [Phycisphaerales bacterium AB-hyl4]|uniref:PEP-CTERM sorting domain-containing protein n=1 Tax=Natronomicrosphaera hydrolytica TaxID=3242702 RepID=A0ABV4U055_9BACT
MLHQIRPSIARPETLGSSIRNLLAVPFAALALGFASSASASFLVQDDFNRPNSQTLGVMSDGVHSWSESGGEGGANARINSNLLRLYDAGNHGVAVAGFTVADAIISVDLAELTRNRAGVTYRAPSEGDAYNLFSATNTYQVVIRQNWAGTEDIELRYANTQLATYDFGPGVDFETGTLRIEFEGDRHQVFYNDTSVIDMIHAGNMSAGYIGIAAATSQSRWDNFTVIPEPASAALVGLGALLALRRRRN